MAKMRICKAALVSALALSMTACSGSGTSEVKQIADAQKEYGCSVINVYNAGEYIGDGVLENFEKMYNAKVNYDLFESNEIMYTKLLGGSSYDVLVPSDYTIQRLIEENMLQKLDKDAIENLANLDPDVVEMQKAYDPTLEYAAPYFWGSVGIVYNTTTVDQAQVEEEGYNILQDSQYAGRVYVYDSQRDSFMMAFKALGYSMNTEDEAEIQDAYQWLLSMDKAVDPSYVTDEVIDGMVNGDKDIAIMYSGDAAYVLSQNEDMTYWEPTSGTNTWTDAMVIPSNSSCPGLANAFINYILSYDASYANSYTVGYASTNQEVLDKLSGEGGEYEGNVAYLPRTGYAKDEVFGYSEILREELGDLWNKVKVSN